MITPGYKTTEFWSHAAAFLAGLATTLGSVFDASFVANHPRFSMVLAVAGMALMGLSSAAYQVSRGLTKAGSSQPSVSDGISV